MSDASESILLFPSDPLDRRRCDPHFRPEFVAARDIGVEVAVFDDMALHQGQGSPDVRPLSGRKAIYRGWMLSGAAYHRLHAAVQQVGATLLTDPGDYGEVHYLPGWYEAFSRHTPFSVWAEDGMADPLPLLAELPAGAAIVKDWSKSMKHLWEEACFIADVRDEIGALRVIDRFRELRGADLHGLVLRQFEDFGDEYRTWWVDGRPALVTAHPDTPSLEPDAALDLAPLVPAVSSLGARLITVDVAVVADGIRVVEVGDAMVSDRPDSCDPETFLRALLLS